MDTLDSLLLPDDDNPWLGLAPYTGAAESWFHGRDQEAAELLRLIRHSPLVMLYSKAGLGKSSLLQAGVFPVLRTAGFLPVYLRLNYAEGATPQQQAFARLLQEVAHADADAAPPATNECLWSYLQRREWPIWTRDNFTVRPVLVFDQFEEVFLRAGTPEQVRQMLGGIADLASNRMPAKLVEDREAMRRLNLLSQQYCLVLSFRSDFLAEVESWKRHASLPKHEALELRAMTREIAIDAVAEAGAAVLAPGVASQIVDFVLDHDDIAGARRATEVEPALLSLCCYQLNNLRQRPAKIDSTLLQNVGKDILLGFYRDALAGTEPRVSVFIEDNLIHGGRYRNRYARDAALASGAITAAELELLTERRLLRIDSLGDVPRIELIHDRLVGLASRARDDRLGRERQVFEAEKARRLARHEHLVAAVSLLSVALGLALLLAYYAWTK